MEAFGLDPNVDVNRVHEMECEALRAVDNASTLGELSKAESHLLFVQSLLDFFIDNIRQRNAKAK
jgi:hypothetical protein